MSARALSAVSSLFAPRGAGAAPVRALLVLLLGVSLGGCAEKKAPPAPAPVQTAAVAPAPAPATRTVTDARFLEVVQPILNRRGCSAGTCHGGIRKGGFQFKGNPPDDYAEVLARVDRKNPDESQLLKKALGLVEHNGGRNLGPSECDTQRLRAWISGAADPGCEKPADREALEQAEAQRFARELAPALRALGCDAAACHGKAGARGVDLSALAALAALTAANSADKGAAPTDKGAAAALGVSAPARVGLRAIVAAGLNRQAVWQSGIIKALRGEDGRAEHKAEPFASCAYRRVYGFVAKSPEERCALPGQKGAKAERLPDVEAFGKLVLPHVLRRGCGDGGCHGGGAGGMTLFNVVEDPRVIQHDYLALTARVEDLRKPQESTLLRTARNQEPHGGGKRLGQRGDCIDDMLTGWLQGRAVRACPPPKPPSFEVFASKMQPLIDHLTCSQAKCHGAGVGEFWLTAKATGEKLRKNYDQVTRHIDYDYTPFSGIILRMRETCAYAMTAAWIEGTPQPRCTPGKIDPALLPKLPTEGAPAHVLPKET